MAGWRLDTVLGLSRYGKLWCVLGATGVVGCLDPLVEDPGVNGDLSQWEQSDPGIPEVPGANPGAAGPNGGAPTAGGSEIPNDPTDPAQPIAPGAAPQSPDGEADAPSGSPTAVAPAPTTGTPEPTEPSEPPSFGETAGSVSPNGGADGNQDDYTEDEYTDDEFSPADGGVEAGSRLLIRAPQADAGDAGTPSEGGL